jgi:hypothetical protein
MPIPRRPQRIRPSRRSRLESHAGLLSPDGSIQFVTSGGAAVGNVSHLASFRPLATAVPLATPFSVPADLYPHQWAAGDPHGAWTFFVGVVTASTSFSFP